MSRQTGGPGFKPITALLRQLQSAMRQSMEEALDEVDLTLAQANVLTELAYGPARSNAELARIQFVTPQTMVEILLTLEDKGLISRTAQPKGGRAMLAQLTSKGTTKVLAVHLAMRKFEEQLSRSLSKDDISRMRRLLENCVMALENRQAGSDSH